MTDTIDSPDQLSVLSEEKQKLALGLALSGGGFRATLFHLGVTRCLSDAGLLGNVSHLTSVSGGSILAAHLFEQWNDYLVDFDKAAKPLIEFIQYDIRGRILRRLPYSFIYRRWRRTALLQKYYHKLFLPKLSEATETAPADTNLPSRPHLAILATNLNSGSMYAFSEQFVYVLYRDEVKALRTDLPLTSLKVAISSAFPGFFPPITLSHHDVALDVAEFQESQCFTDGGVFDNLGIRFFQRAYDFNSRPTDSATPSNSQYFWNTVPDIVLASNASSAFDVRQSTSTLLGTAMRAVDILMNRIGVMDVESIIGGRGEDANRFSYLAIDTLVDNDEDPHSLNMALQKAIRFIRTDLDAFSKFECRCLIQHGYCVARKELRQLRASNTLPSGKPTQDLEEGLARVEGREAWDPFTEEPSTSVEQPLRGYAHTEISTEIAKEQSRRLHRSSRPRIRLLALGDPIPTLMNAGILFAILTLLVVTGWRATFQPQEPDWQKDPVIDTIEKNNQLTVGIYKQSDLDFGYHLWADENGRVSNKCFDILLASELSKNLHQKLGQEFEDLEPPDWESRKDFTELLKMPKNNEAHIIISTISFMADREKRYDLRFSVPYASTSQTILGHKDISGLDINQLREHTENASVFVAKETTAVDIAKWMQMRLEWIPEAIKDFDGCEDSFKNDESAFMLTDTTLATALQEGGDYFGRELLPRDFPSKVFPERRKEYYVIGMSKKSPRFAWAINSILIEMAKDGRLIDLQEEAEEAYLIWKGRKLGDRSPAVESPGHELKPNP